MKNLLLIIALVLLLTPASALFSQTMVSTDPQPKNVILEEFTGINCQFCPDGHRVANEISAANPGRVFIVNIHAGSYAAPQSGQPDYRTTEGNQIEAACGPDGYPKGSINRSTTPWATPDRAKWVSTSNTIMSQTSPVNVAVKSQINFTTRELVTEVEYYYTSKSASANNYLTVVLTQSNILGPQIDGGNFNPTNWFNGLYKHNHALRMVLSSGGAFGETITTTEAGTFGTKKYTTVLPEQINGIDVVLYNLQVVAFVSESQSNIYSGAGVEVDFDHSLTTDLGMTDKTVAPTSLCFTNINPKIEVVNSSTKTVTSFEVNAKINGVDNKKAFEGTLAAGEKTTIDWGDVALNPVGNYQIAFSGFGKINNGEIADVDMANDAATLTGLGFKAKSFSSFLAGFDNARVPVNMGVDLTQNSQVALYNSPALGANNTAGALFFILLSSANVSGKPAHLIFGEAELSKLKSPTISYSYAYSDGSQGGTKPTVKVDVSEDCGVTWTTVNTTSLTETGQPAQAGYYYVPKSADYKVVPVSLANYSDKDVLLRLSVIPGTNGLDMFIDEITVASSTGVNDENNEFNMQVSPNPIASSSVFTYTINDLSNISINMVDVLGNTVRELATGFVSQGNYSVNLNAQGLASGTYYIIANINDKTATIPVVINK
ncbi:MAG: Omp28-related outer membrane protein [bacterium]